MSKESDYTFGQVTVTCDECGEEHISEGFDGHPPQYKDVQDEIRGLGWRARQENGHWVDLCPDCSGADE